jgi:hypothetical protein
VAIEPLRADRGTVLVGQNINGCDVGFAEGRMMRRVRRGGDALLRTSYVCTVPTDNTRPVSAKTKPMRNIFRLLRTVWSDTVVAVSEIFTGLR